MKKTKQLGVLLLGALALASCSDESKDFQEPILKEKGEAITFRVLDDQTTPTERTPSSRIGLRTAYGEKVGNQWPIKWVNGDRLQINKYGSESQSYEYTVTKKDGQETFGYLQVSDAQSVLTWSKDKTKPELFSMVYPASAQSGFEPTDNTVTVKYNFDQTKAFDRDANGNYTIKAEEGKDLIMVGFLKQQYTKDPIDFRVSPATTTIDATLKGRTDASIAVSSVVVTIDNKNCFINKDGEVKYKYENGEIVPQPWPASKCNATVKYTVSVNNDLGFVDLDANKTINFKAFIPGFEQSATSFTINLGGYSKKLNLPALNKNVRFYFTTPNLPKEGTDDWITPLDDDVLVSSMSIPGTFQSASWDPWASTGNNLKVQDLNLEQQWKMGIRAFYVDLYIAGIAYEGNSSYLWAGIKGAPTYYASNQSLKMLVDFLNNKLAQSPGEFTVLIVSNLQEESNFTNNLMQFLNKNTSSLAKYTSNMTVKDLRGKVLLMHGSSQNHEVGLRMTGWTGFDGATGITNETLSNSNGVSEPVKFLNGDEFYYTYASNVAVWAETVYRNITNHGDGWAITITAAHSPNRNRSDYAHICKDVLNNLQYRIAQHKGSTGIVLMPFVGTRKIQTGVEENPVYGDILAQTIISKNYRFPLKRE